MQSIIIDTECSWTLTLDLLQNLGGCLFFYWQTCVYPILTLGETYFTYESCPIFPVFFAAMAESHDLSSTNQMPHRKQLSLFSEGWKWRCLDSGCSKVAVWWHSSALPWKSVMSVISGISWRDHLLQLRTLSQQKGPVTEPLFSFSLLQNGSKFPVFPWLTVEDVFL